jgi:hypothetical protein
MRTPSLVTLALWATTAALAQGTINFNNRAPADNIDAIVTCAYEPLAGSPWVAQLYSGPSADSLEPIGVPVAFKTGSLAGYVSGGVVDAKVPAGATVYVQMRVWRITDAPAYEQAQLVPGARWGLSGSILVKTGGGDPPAPASNLIGLEPFDICIPEPAVVALGLLGGFVLWLARRRDLSGR